MSRIPVLDATLEVSVSGSGEPVVLIQTALIAEEFVPVASQPVLADSYELVMYHRRGYAGSSPVQGPGSIERDAADCEELLNALDFDRAHVVGVSHGAAVALQLAATTPDRVHSLCLIEPPPVHIPSAEEFRSANEQLLADYREQGPATALDRFLSRVVGPNWHRDLERQLPGSVVRRGPPARPGLAPADPRRDDRWRRPLPCAHPRTASRGRARGLPAPPPHPRIDWTQHPVGRQRSADRRRHHRTPPRSLRAVARTGEAHNARLCRDGDAQR